MSRNRSIARLTGVFGMVIGAFGCSTLPEPSVKEYSFPEKGVYVDRLPERKFDRLSLVRVKVNYTSMNAKMEEDALCKNYYNKAAHDLLARVREEQHGDAVIEVKSVAFYMDGTHKTYDTPECSDDGSEGQILLQGTGIRYVRPKPKKKGDPE